MNNQHKIKILLIAPYVGLIKLFEEAVRHRDNIELEAYESDTIDSVPLIKALPMENYDIIISRGYTCKMIRSVCDRHVLDVGISIYDVLRAIRLAQNYNGRFAIVGFQSIIYYASVLKDVLRCEFDIYTIRDIEEIDTTLKELKHKGYTMIVGDVITIRIARENGLQTILITTNPESVETVLDNSLSLYEEQLLLKKQSRFYKNLLFSLDAGIAIYDRKSNLLFSNRLEAPETPRQLARIIQKSVSLLFEKERLRFVKTLGNMHYTITGRLVSYDEEPMAAFFFNSSEYTRVSSGLVRFYDPDEPTAISQRTFHSLSPALKRALESIRTFRLFSRPVVIVGPVGSGKDSFVCYLYKNCNCTETPMIVIDCNYAVIKDWEYLTGNEDSPLFGSGYVLYFKDIQLLNEQQQDQLLMFIHSSAIGKRNQLIFSCAPDSPTHFMKGSLKNEIINTLHSLVLTIPSLNERREDIPNLATLYLNELNSQMATQAIAFEPDALQLLQEFDWTDNLHQFRRVLEDLVLNANSSFITKEEVLSILEKSRSDYHHINADLPVSVDGTLNEITKKIIHQVLREENMNQSRAAKRLGIGRSTLRRYL